ncbi:MAG: hypothetical protein IK100_10445 [Muribaculaceae bacterium]|nr:hypothetical protein [Muribaculaceae bacterium]
MDYDNLGVNGIKGVLSAKTLVADWNLTRRSFSAMHHYKSSSSPEHSVALCTGVAFAAITATKIRLLLTPSISIIYIIASMLF